MGRRAASARGRRAFRWLDGAVRPREHEAFVTVGLPPDDVRRAPALSAHIDDLAMALGVADTATVHRHPVALGCLHPGPPSRPPACTPSNVTLPPLTQGVAAHCSRYPRSGGTLLPL